jgi:hypothetical protein
MVLRFDLACIKLTYTGAALATLIDRVDIKGHSRSQKFPDSTSYLLSDNNMEIAVYTLHTDKGSGTLELEKESGDTSLPFHMTHLPHQTFDGYWDALVYQDPIGEYALRVMAGAIRKFHNSPADLVQNAWYNTALFHGPPGSGKTCLAQALAQQLSIRVSDIYPNTKLLQVDGSAVFSHMYGGTAREIGSLFTTIHRLACDDEVEAQLVVVLIDEVEKLVPCRRSVGQKNEPMDTLRVRLL